ncbi:hypothetical protein BCR41DRAFT_391333 [Lobosporangium transversale]|uniref:Uncharacterized protein n=1 Tax=Lobosporangium transversale TaxID=64571 RepID=A0A1Y2H2Z9_9FUNG|nr:hypothetical protein BCR41DRAFT_391333 [Lobosporangium transversale]ORZ28918.1 hypothetical protein BCR41DRAFT_391333 [Lobosporangium transversale]|eukprot:XP_021886591.1 hypothetical protein BCR41DRAFT_391333 [Lobosporangium transversale]
MVEEKGALLSDAHKQGIATSIARKLIKDPQTLLLDEAISALVIKYERVVQASLNDQAVVREQVVKAV